jgi:hypothetical protein
MKNKNQMFFAFAVNYILLFKSFLAGALLAEVFILANEIGKAFVECSIINQKEIWLWLMGISYSFIILTFLFRNDFGERIWVLIRSLRFDLMIILFSGSYFVFIFGGLGVDCSRGWIKSLTWSQLTTLISLPVIIFLSLILKKLQARFLAKNDQDSFFMSDKAGRNKSDDKFGFSDQAERFAERVFNQGSPESLVFGIDAPWGTGKSTFVNLCKEYWRENYENEIIVYSFDPLRYENKENILKKFVDGLVKEIRKHIFAPEIESLVSKYTKLLKDSKASFSFLGLSLSLPLLNESMDDIFERLETALLSIDKKIVIIVDDLDRLDFSTIKDVLFVIKKAFTLPNISYVLCYDTENIATLGQKNTDSEKIAEFLEKFVNVKTSLYLDNKILLEYFTRNKDESLSKNLLVNREFISKAVEGLRDIFESKDFHNYLPFVGDARKIKRLINTILLLEVEKTDFDNCDFDKQDLIHLLLIYINYPNIFRKIYNTETQGKKGFFSVVFKYEEGYPKSNISQCNDEDTCKNSTYYTEYLNKLSENQQFILNKVFQRLTGPNANKITQEISTSYACLNGSKWGDGNRNLEAYLNLITKMSRPIRTQQHKFYINCKNNLLSDKSIEEILLEEEFSFSKGEINHQQLWTILVNSPSQEFTPEKSKELICYLLNNLTQYSLLEIQNIGVGYRNYLIFYLVKLLDKFGWGDGQDKYFSNADENIANIAKWILGEDEYNGEGVLETLGNEDRGVMGLYDLLAFRLKCCADRNGDIYNLSRSLSKHGSPQAPTTGETRIIVIEEMREMSQKVFSIFKSQFIDQKKNIFEEIENLTINDVSGKNFSYIKSKIDSGDIKSIETMLSELKSSIKAFIVYQLGNEIIDMGIGCGYYDISESKDEKGINYSINEYLFDHCFNPQISKLNYKHFLDYMLINLSQPHMGFGNDNCAPHISEFTQVLKEERLAAYWRKHSSVIKTNEFTKEERKIFTSNYALTYDTHLESIYKVLDELINN